RGRRRVAHRRDSQERLSHLRDPDRSPARRDHAAERQPAERAVTRLAFAGALLAASLPLTASAQTAADATQPPVNQGPMTVERIHSGFAAMPEVKITDFDGKASGLVGGTAGYVAEEAFFFGGGGYWMATDRSHSRELAYGGFVMQWFVLNSDRFGVSGKVLLGGGQATTPQAVTQVVGLPTPRELNQLT